MRKFYSLLFVFLGVVFYTQAQISQGGTPLSFAKNHLTESVEFISLAAPDMEKVRAEDQELDTKSGKYRCGIVLPVNISPENSGTWDILPDGSKIWRVMIASNGCQGLELFFDKYRLPKGVQLFVYSPQKDVVLGAFTEFNNINDETMAIQMLPGEVSVVELNIPADVNEADFLRINEIGYTYRGWQDNSKVQSCEVNVACSEGSTWTNQRNGVAKILLKIGSDTYLCSGSLINNTYQNCDPYFLTADHCGAGSTTANMNQWIFYFNYEASTCAGTTAQYGSHTVTGCALKAHDTYGTNNTGSDFYLVKLNNSVPNSYNPYYSGWSKQTTVSTSGVGIHHPDGAIKKISTYNNTLSTGYTTHWSVVWVATTNGHGVTEGGSSGSPIFNSTGLIIGTLTGGLSACSAGEAGTGTGPDEYDIYGKFFKHWDANGSTSDKQLKPWLDPAGSNPTTLSGRSYCVAGLDDISYIRENINVFPNPANDILNIDFSNYNVSDGQIFVTDLLGKQVIEPIKGNFDATFELNVAGLKAGMYYVILTTPQGKVAIPFSKQ